MNYAKFEIAFWHPFGPHGDESAKEIIERKCGEIVANEGWTLWSFRHRLMLNVWHRELLSAKQNAIFVFCSDSPGAKDPVHEGSLSKPINCQSYRCVGDKDTQWRPMPPGVKVPHPFRPSTKQKRASAFVVQRIIYPVELSDRPTVEWLNKGGHWCQETVPTHGEYLIRPGGDKPMRKVRAVLELKPPYLAIVTSDERAG